MSFWCQLDCFQFEKLSPGNQIATWVGDVGRNSIPPSKNGQRRIISSNNVSLQWKRLHQEVVNLGVGRGWMIITCHLSFWQHIVLFLLIYITCWYSTFKCFVYTYCYITLNKISHYLSTFYFSINGLQIYNLGKTFSKFTNVECPGQKWRRRWSRCIQQ